MAYHDWPDVEVEEEALPALAPAVAEEVGVEVLVTVTTTTLCVAVGAVVVERSGSIPCETELQKVLYHVCNSTRSASI